MERERSWPYPCQYSVHNQKFPAYDEAKLTREILNIAVQVNGRLREVVPLPSGMCEDEIKSAILANGKIQSFIGGQEIKRIIYIKGRIINIVLMDIKGK